MALFSSVAWAGGAGTDLTGHWIGWLCIAIFVLAYALVIAEENLRLRKSKPGIVAAGIVRALVAILLQMHGGQAPGIYTFAAHLKWTWAIALGYAASIRLHFLVNESLFLLPPIQQ